MLGRQIAILTGGGKPPSLDLNLTGSLDGRIAFVRNSTASFFDITGTLQQAARDIARFDNDPVAHTARGLFIEEARVNSIRNPRGLNAVIGGALPTYWSQSNTTGLTFAVTGSGIENGIWYLELRLNGTTSGTTNTLLFDATITASPSSTWTISTYLKLQSGSLSNVSSFQLVLNDNIANGQAAITSPTSSGLGAYRPTFTRTTNAGAVTGLNGVGLQIISTATSAIDLTIRLGLPQVELGAGVTSPIF